MTGKLLTTRSQYPDTMRADAVALMSQGIPLREIEKRLKATYGRGPDHTTISEWRNDPDYPALTYGQSQEIALRAGQIQHQQLAAIEQSVTYDDQGNINNKADLLKHGFLVNAIRGTALDKIAGLPALVINANQVLVQQLVALPRDQRQAWLERGTLPDVSSDADTDTE